MDGRTMRTLAEYITELHRRDRNSNRTSKQPGFDTTLNGNVDSEQGDRDGDERHSKDNTGQSWNYICR
jgi:hypothetical protein